MIGFMGFTFFPFKTGVTWGFRILATTDSTATKYFFRRTKYHELICC